MLLKSNNNKNYGLNLSRINLLCKLFGLKNKKYKNNLDNITLIEKEIDTFLKMHLIKKEHLIKIKVLNKLKKIENGSYMGYLDYRGLPINNQRTKTNSRTSRRILLK